MILLMVGFRKLGKKDVSVSSSWQDTGLLNRETWVRIPLRTPNFIMKFLRNQKGFTLIELIAVMIILGVMLIIIVPRYMDFDNHADQKMEQLQQNATDRYEVIRSTGMETGLDAEGNDVNESEGRLTKEK